MKPTNKHVEKTHDSVKNIFVSAEDKTKPKGGDIS